MTIDSVVQKTAITLGVVILTAMATWILTPDITSRERRHRQPRPAVGRGHDRQPRRLRAVDGQLVQARHQPGSGARLRGPRGRGPRCHQQAVRPDVPDGVVTGAVIGTFAAFAGTLAAYKVLNIKVGDKFRGVVIAAVFGMVGHQPDVELVLSMFGIDLGIFGNGGLGVLFALAGLVLGIFMLILDFDFVEQGIANQIPEWESWRAAFAMTVSLVWIYTNLLRLLAIFSSD